jgi:hypothetical protein
LTIAAAAMLATTGARAAEPTGIEVDKEKKTVSIDAKIAPRKMPYLDQIYPIEVIACFAYNGPIKGEKAHETVVTIEAMPSKIHQALESLGLTVGKPADLQNDKPAQGPELNVYIEFTKDDGSKKRVLVNQILVDIKTGKPLPKSVKFHFTGSIMIQVDPAKPEKSYGADQSGTLIAIFPVTDKTIMQSTLTMKEEKYVKLEVDKKVLPKEGTPVKLVLEVPH